MLICASNIAASAHNAVPFANVSAHARWQSKSAKVLDAQMTKHLFPQRLVEPEICSFSRTDRPLDHPTRPSFMCISFRANMFRQVAPPKK